VQVHESEQVLGVGIAGVAGGAQQRDRLVELQGAQRRARGLERILGCNALRGSRGRGQAHGAAQCGDQKFHHAVPNLVATWMPTAFRKSFCRMPPALTITASLRSVIPFPECFMNPSSGRISRIWELSRI